MSTPSNANPPGASKSFIRIVEQLNQHMESTPPLVAAHPAHVSLRDKVTESLHAGPGMLPSLRPEHRAPSTNPAYQSNKKNDGKDGQDGTKKEGAAPAKQM